MKSPIIIRAHPPSSLPSESPDIIMTRSKATVTVNVITTTHYNDSNANSSPFDHCFYIRNYLNILYHILLVPFKIVTDPDGHIRIEECRPQKILCGLAHTLIGLYTVSCIRGELIDSLIKRPEQLFGCISNVVGVLSSIAFCQTFFCKDKSRVLKNCVGFANKTENEPRYRYLLAICVIQLGKILLFFYILFGTVGLFTDFSGFLRIAWTRAKVITFQERIHNFYGVGGIFTPGDDGRGNSTRSKILADNNTADWITPPEMMGVGMMFYLDLHRMLFATSNDAIVMILCFAAYRKSNCLNVLDDGEHNVDALLLQNWKHHLNTVMDGIDEINLLASPLILWIFGQVIPLFASKSIDVWESNEYLQWLVIVLFAVFYGTMGYFAAAAHEKVQQRSATYFKIVTKFCDPENQNIVGDTQIANRTMEILVASELRDRSNRCGIWGGPFTLISHDGFFASVISILLTNILIAVQLKSARSH